MDIVLFHPAPRSGWQVQRRVELPLGLLCPATPLARQGHNVRIIDGFASPTWKRELREALRQKPSGQLKRNRAPFEPWSKGQGCRESMEKSVETNGFGNAYWDAIAAESTGKDREELWRAHLREVYRNLKERWRGGEKPLSTLKTDLYDEAVSTHNLISLFGTGSKHIVGTDVSLETARAAKRRMAGEWTGWSRIAVSDARRQAFKSNVFDEILSNSTLDHFVDKSHILESLGELCRMMKPGGTLIITIDNPWNPAVWVRNRLPYRLLRAVGLVSFFMGATLSKPELVRALEGKGFRVCDSTAIVHGPRILAIWTGHLLARTGHARIREGFHRLMRLFERLEALPTKYLTGYYVAVKAVKI